jgi:hypothetical protein
MFVSVHLPPFRLRLAKLVTFHYNRNINDRRTRVVAVQSDWRDL